MKKELMPVHHLLMNDEDKKGRYGNTGYLYNIHAPINPVNGKEENTYVGILGKYTTIDELENR